MKKLILFVLLIAIYGNCSYAKMTEAQVNDSLNVWRANGLSDNNGLWSMTRIVELPGLSAEQIYNGVIEYLSTTLDNPKGVIQQQDRQSGLIVGKGTLTTEPRKINMLTYLTFIVDETVKINIKEGRIRIVLTTGDITVQGMPQAGVVNIRDWAPYNPKSKKIDNDFKNMSIIYKRQVDYVTNLVAGIKSVTEDSNW